MLISGATLVTYCVENIFKISEVADITEDYKCIKLNLQYRSNLRHEFTEIVNNIIV